MPGHECYHCKQLVEKGEAHDCWTTTERALTQDLSEDLHDAWLRVREAIRLTAVERDRCHRAIVHPDLEPAPALVGGIGDEQLERS